MPSESKLRSAGLLRAGALLLVVSAFTLSFLGADDYSSDITGTWKADLSKTSPPDNNELAVTLTITEIGLRTYTINFDRQTTDRGVVSEELKVSCDGKSRPPGRSGVAGATVYCGRAYPISIRVTHNDGMLIEHVIRLPDGNSLNYTKTTYGHDRTYVFSRQ